MSSKSREKTVILSGTRHCTHPLDVAKVERLLKRVEAAYPAPARFHLVHGACRGVDVTGSRWAVKRPRWRQTAYPADWSMGRRAGPARNARMLRENPPHVAVLVPRKGSKGTLHMRGLILKRAPKPELVLEEWLQDRREDSDFEPAS